MSFTHSQDGDFKHCHAEAPLAASLQQPCNSPQVPELRSHAIDVAGEGSIAQQKRPPDPLEPFPGWEAKRQHMAEGEGLRQQPGGSLPRMSGQSRGECEQVKAVIDVSLRSFVEDLLHS